MSSRVSAQLFEHQCNDLTRQAQSLMTTWEGQIKVIRFQRGAIGSAVHSTERGPLIQQLIPVIFEIEVSCEPNRDCLITKWTRLHALGEKSGIAAKEQLACCNEAISLIHAKAKEVLDQLYQAKTLVAPTTGLVQGLWTGYSPEALMQQIGQCSCTDLPKCSESSRFFRHTSD